MLVTVARPPGHGDLSLPADEPVPVVTLHEPHATGGLTMGEVSRRDAPESWHLICRELDVSLISDWERLGLTL